MDREEKTLRNLYERIQYNPDLFKVFIGEDKYIRDSRALTRHVILRHTSLCIRLFMIQ